MTGGNITQDAGGASKLSAFNITLAEAGDLEAILDLQHLAYQSEAELYADYSIPPLKQTLPQIELEFTSHVFLKIGERGRILGSVRARADQETCFVGKLIVHPEAQGQGIGTALMHGIEAHFREARRFELFTGHKSERNLRLYHRLGYHECRRERVHAGLTLVYMEKLRRLSG